MEIYYVSKKVEKIVIEDNVLEKLMKEMFQEDNYELEKSENKDYDIKEAFFGQKEYEILKKNGVAEEVDSDYYPYLDIDDAFRFKDFGYHGEID